MGEFWYCKDDITWILRTSNLTAPGPAQMESIQSDVVAQGGGKGHQSLHVQLV